ncbi:MAG TPA: hypothetical protein VN283_00580 [Thiobacillus sp.]|nr:hypothetical protein [Thiobacillus sp.]
MARSFMQGQLFSHDLRFRTRDWILAYRQRTDGGVLSHQNLDTSAVQ